MTLLEECFIIQGTLLGGSDDPRVFSFIYDRQLFIVQATGQRWRRNGGYFICCVVSSLKPNTKALFSKRDPGEAFAVYFWLLLHRFSSDELQPTGRNRGRRIGSRSGCWCEKNRLCFVSKRPNLKLRVCERKSFNVLCRKISPLPHVCCCFPAFF